MTSQLRKLSGNWTLVSSTPPFFIILVAVIAPRRLPRMPHQRYHTRAFLNRTMITVFKLRPANRDRLSTCHIRQETLPLWWWWRYVGGQTRNLISELSRLGIASYVQNRHVAYGSRTVPGYISQRNKVTGLKPLQEPLYTEGLCNVFDILSKNPVLLSRCLNVPNSS
jgi:hypothetical protein